MRIWISGCGDRGHLALYALRYRGRVQVTGETGTMPAFANRVDSAVYNHFAIVDITFQGALPAARNDAFDNTVIAIDACYLIGQIRKLQ